MSVVDWPKESRAIVTNRDITKAIQAMNQRGVVGEDEPQDVAGMITILNRPSAHILAWKATKTSMRLAIWSTERGRLVPWELALGIAKQFARALQNEKHWDVKRFDHGVLFEAELNR